jgi:hypothetical protein
MQVGIAMQKPRRQSTEEKLDLGYEIIEQLLRHQEPLTDDQIDRFSRMWISDRGLQVTYYSMKLAHRVLESHLESIRKCTDPNRVPLEIIKNLCRCSLPSVNNYNSLIVKTVKARVSQER